MSITHIALDIDGVIYSAEDFIADAYRKAIEESPFDLPLPTTEQIMAQIGKPIREIFSNLFPGISEEDMIEFRKWTRKNVVRMVREKRGMIYDGIPDLIKSLSKSFTLAACSNGGAGYITAILETYDLSGYFIPVLTLESENVRDKAGLLRSYISKSGSFALSWLMVGDRKTDLDAARINGCKFIGCTWGHAYEGELTGADVKIESPEELLNFISTHWKT